MEHATAAVFVGPGRPLEIQSFELPRLMPGEGLVAVDCCTLCGSDFHSILGTRKTVTPTVLGHEIVGRLVEVSAGMCDLDGIPLQVGDRVSWAVAASCGICFFCQNGLPQKCEQVFKYGHQPLQTGHPLSGGLATHCHLTRNTKIVRVPEYLPDTAVSPANCATATIAAAIRMAGGCSGQTVMIVGAGMLGLTASAMSAHLGAKNVFVTDIDQYRAARATNFNATHYDPERLRAETDGRGVDIVFDTSGSPEAIEQSLDHLRTGGRLMLIGAVFPSRPISLSAESVVRRMWRIEGVHNYKPEDLRAAIDFLAAACTYLALDRLVEREYPLTDINRALADAGSNNWIRIAIRPSPEKPDGSI